MSNWFFPISILATGLSGFPSLFLSRNNNLGHWLSAGLNVFGSFLGLYAAFRVLFVGIDYAFSLAWTLPGGPLVFTVDALSAAFMIPVYLLSALSAIYGLEYWKQSENQKNGQKLRFFYGLMTAAMLALTAARQGIFFLMAWEIMALSGYFVLTTQDDDEKVREAGWIYFVATHFSTLILFAFFALYGVAHGSLILERFGAGEAGSTANALFLLALVGFGIKAGLFPVHGWLPPAHANAPSHVSAFFSGVFIKMGVYGVLRVVWMFPEPPLWWGLLVLSLGMISGLLGVIYAIGQHDIKRLLAYHSIENIGIIFLGVGLALIGIHAKQPAWMALGIAGAVLHVWNHGLFKSLLFLSAGSAIHRVHTREIDRLGGLAKRMPLTSFGFLIGAAAICGLPPLNGFISELAIYLGLFSALQKNTSSSVGVVILSIASLALIGGLAVACFVKVYGIVFLGEPRTPAAEKAHESSSLITSPILVLAFLCAFIGLFPVFTAPMLDSVIALWGDSGQSLSQLMPLRQLSWMGGFLIVFCALGYLFLRRTIRIVPHEEIGTWDCGYLHSSPRIQYTASSFAQMIVDLFTWVLWPAKKVPSIHELFPKASSFHSHVPDVVMDRGVLPFFRQISQSLESFKVFQSGKLQVYLFYIFMTLLILLILV